jgi:phage terminase small subunit
MRKLSAREQRFCWEYVKDHVGQRAAVRAGYSAHSAAAQASRLLKKRNVAALIGRLDARVAEKAEVTAEEVLRRLDVTVKRAMRKTGPQYLQAALKGIDLQGRNFGLFKQAVKHEGTVSLVIQETLVKHFDPRAEGKAR